MKIFTQCDYKNSLGRGGLLRCRMEVQEADLNLRWGFEKNPNGHVEVGIKSNQALHRLCQYNCGITLKPGVFQVRNLCTGWALLASFILCPHRCWPKSHARKTRGSAQLMELWQVKAGGPQSLTSSLDTKKETETTTWSSRRDPDSTLVSDVQPTAARWVCELQKSSFLRSPADASSWMQPCSAATRWAKDLLGADAPCWFLGSAPKAYSPETQKRLAASTGMWRLFFSQKEG